jgi:hypothetical protein
VRSSISTVGVGVSIIVSGRNGFGRVSEVYLFDTNGHNQPSIEAPSQPSVVVFDKKLQPTIAPGMLMPAVRSGASMTGEGVHSRQRRPDRTASSSPAEGNHR